MSPIGTTRHYGGGEGRATPPVEGWKCPSCGNLNANNPAEGCHVCGAGTPEESERARAEGAAGLIKPIDLQHAVCGEAPLDTATGLPGLEPKARLTLAKALAFYADAGAPNNEELSRVYCLAWGRAILAALEGTGDERTAP